ncbi:oxidoreductase [Roseovarius sp.]|uniref:oxidoreductase n=1 Tax=Roseovarius sp. TaxID=1486281 RepID=UPI00356222D7
MQTGLFDPITLPNGVVLKNRLVKSAMSDTLGDGYGNPTPEQWKLYETWDRGGVAASVVGEVQGDPRTIEHPGNLVLDPGADLEAFRALAHRGQATGAALWLQLGHAGALTPEWVGMPKAPSSLNIEGIRCDALSLTDIAALPDRFARTARLACDLGFGGVQVHAAHGFLLSQFLSPLFNRRQDAYGGSATNRMRLVIETVEAVRAEVPSGFCVSIKLNATDQIIGGLTQEDALEVVAALDGRGLDLMEFSGGTYFPGAPAESDGASSGPYFVDFARTARQMTSVPLMATGGFKKRADAEYAVGSGAVDCIGLARALVLDPALPKTWKENGPDPDFPRFERTVPGGITAWYTASIHGVASGDASSPVFYPGEAVEAMSARTRQLGQRMSSRIAGEAE